MIRGPIRVRRAPVTGLNKARRKQRRIRGMIYLNSIWYGKKVAVMDYADYLALKRAAKQGRTLAGVVIKEAREYLGA